MSQFSTSVPPGGMMIDNDPKTSLAAVLGFVVSLIGCCLPTGMLGAALGVFSLIGISKSGGRVSGKGLAIAAIIIGVINTLIWIGLVVGGLAWGRSVNQFGTQAGAFLTAVEAGEYDESRTMLGGPIATIDDGSLARFSDSVHANLGSFVAAPDSLGSLISGYFTLGQSMSNNPISKSVPIPLQFENGQAIVQYVYSTDQTVNGLPAMTDLQILEADGTAHRLSAFTPAGSPPDVPKKNDTTSKAEPDEDPDAVNQEPDGASPDDTATDDDGP